MGLMNTRTDRSGIGMRQGEGTGRSPTALRGLICHAFRYKTAGETGFLDGDSLMSRGRGRPRRRVSPVL